MKIRSVNRRVNVFVNYCETLLALRLSLLDTKVYSTSLLIHFFNVYFNRKMKVVYCIILYVEVILIET